MREGMSAVEALRVRVGDMVTARPLWNASTRHEKIDIPTVVLATREERNSQSGVMLQVRLKNGTRRWLSAGWFVPNLRRP